MKSIEKVVCLQIKLSIKITDSENLELQWETFYTSHPKNVKVSEILLLSPETHLVLNTVSVINCLIWLNSQK